MKTVTLNGFIFSTDVYVSLVVNDTISIEYRILVIKKQFLANSSHAVEQFFAQNNCFHQLKI